MELWAESERSSTHPRQKVKVLTQAQFNALNVEEKSKLLQDVFFVRDEASLVLSYAFLCLDITQETDSFAYTRPPHLASSLSRYVPHLPRLFYILTYPTQRRAHGLFITIPPVCGRHQPSRVFPQVPCRP
jgi:hypothetical protein